MYMYFINDKQINFEHQQLVNTYKCNRKCNIYTECIQEVYISVDYSCQHAQFPYHRENYNLVVFQMVHMMILLLVRSLDLILNQECSYYV